MSAAWCRMSVAGGIEGEIKGVACCDYDYYNFDDGDYDDAWSCTADPSD